MLPTFFVQLFGLKYFGFLVLLSIANSEKLIQPRASLFSLPSFFQSQPEVTSTGFKNCDPVPIYGYVANFTISPCKESGSCPLIRGTNVTFDLGFVSRVPAQIALLKLSAMFSWFSLPSESVENICSQPGIEAVQCPLAVGVLNHYRKTVYIQNALPSMSFDVKVKVTDNIGNDIACALLPVEIQ